MMQNHNKIPVKLAIDRLKLLCSRSEKSENDIKKKLSEWNLDDQVEKIISILVDEKFIDNGRYAKAFAIDKMRFNKWGKYKIRLTLISKGITETQINKAFGEIDFSEYQKMIFSELDKKKKSLKKTEPHVLRFKLYSFGSQRGYESEIINDYFSNNESS